MYRGLEYPAIMVSPQVEQQALCPTATKTPSERKRQFPKLSSQMSARGAESEARDG